MVGQSVRPPPTADHSALFHMSVTQHQTLYGKVGCGQLLAVVGRGQIIPHQPVRKTCTAESVRVCNSKHDPRAVPESWGRTPFHRPVVEFPYLPPKKV